MAERDRDDESDAPDDRTSNDHRDRRGPFGGVSFELPPITFPAFFPEDFRLRIPIPTSVRTAGNPLLAAITLDLIDAFFILTVGATAGWVRVFIGAVVMGLVFGPFGLLYGLEVIPIIAGVPTVGVFPTATVVALAHRVR